MRFLFSAITVFLFFSSKSMPGPAILTLHINDVACPRESRLYQQMNELDDMSLLNEFKEKHVVFSTKMRRFVYQNNATAIDIFDNALHQIVAIDIGKELIKLLCVKLERRWIVWNTIKRGSEDHKNNLITAIGNCKHDLNNMPQLKAALCSACDFVRCILSPDNLNDIADNAIQAGVNVDFHDFYDTAFVVNQRNVYQRMRLLYSTSKNSNILGEHAEDAILAVPHAVPAGMNQYFNLVDKALLISNKIKIFLGMLDSFIDTADKAMEYDSAIEITDSHKCCFSPSASDRSKIYLNFSDYAPETLVSSGVYTTMQDAGIFIAINRMNRRLLDAIFHEAVHFLHFIEGKILLGSGNLEFLFGINALVGAQNNVIVVRREMIQRWTKDEELSTILGISVEGERVVFDRLSNAGFMHRNLNVVRLWHAAVTVPYWISDVEKEIMRDALDIIDANV